nr:GNAT family N-acetyltransferase [uncultured Cellulosilyticum sp.]
MKYTFIKDYKNQEEVRKSFSELAKKTFCINFEKWYAKGLWGDKYIPYSLMDGDKVISNVSVNLMTFEMDGEVKNYIQLGTVMTDKAYRGQGCLRYLMEEVLAEYVGKVDGIYLFGNDSVIEFYPKFGFKKAREYSYSKEVQAETSTLKMKSVDMTRRENLDKFLKTAREGASQYRFQMRDNEGLLGFYAMDSEMVYQLGSEEVYVVAEVEEDKLFIQDIVARKKVALEEVVGAFGSQIKEVRLGFTPFEEEAVSYIRVEHHEEDCTFFIMGEDLKQVEVRKLMFPALSHA